MKLLDIDFDAEPSPPCLAYGTAAKMQRACDDWFYEHGLASKPIGYDERHPKPTEGAVVLLVDFGCAAADEPANEAARAGAEREGVRL